MYLRINRSTIEKVEEITSTEYETFAGMLSSECVEPMLEDLICEIHRLEEKISDMEQDIENNYEAKEINPYLEYGINEKDFI